MDTKKILRECSGKQIKQVILLSDKQQLNIEFADGSIKRFYTEGDCCSTSWIEHLELPSDLEGAVLLDIKEPGESGARISDDDSYDVTRSYQTIFQTSKGDIAVEYRNNSNGHYGGWLDEIPD